MSIRVNEPMQIGRGDPFESGPCSRAFRLAPPARQVLKRGLDCCVAAGFLLIFAPLLILIAAMVLAIDGGPVIYRHRRIGLNGKPFHCLKFRSMVRDADRCLPALLERSPAAREEWEACRKLREDPRVLGRFGRFLRTTSLDELPQAFNVLRGEMSLVGPRPVVAEELAYYDVQRQWYLSVRPGVTGPWQVGGRNDATYAARVRLDVQYAKYPSLRRDLRILAQTLRVVISRKGAC